MHLRAHSHVITTAMHVCARSHHNGPRVNQNLVVENMQYTELRSHDAVETPNTDVAALFKSYQTGPTFDNSQELFSSDGTAGEIRSTAQADYATAYTKGFAGDFYLRYQWHDESDYGIFLIVLDDLKGFNPKANSGGLSSRAIRNDRSELKIFDKLPYGSNYFKGYKEGKRVMEWYRVDGRTFINCGGCKKRVDITSWVGGKKVFPIFRYASANCLRTPLAH